MQYQRVVPARFLQRQGRFVAHCESLEGEPLRAHLPNTGRCRELLVPGCRAWLSHSDAPGRKTQWSLVAVEKGQRLINLDSQAPNRVAWEGIEQGSIRLPLEPGEELRALRREVRFGDSRLDLEAETDRRRWLVEVKGVTLEEDGGVYFPDAPTLRGRKHLQELCRARQQGFGAAVLFVVQMQGVRHFTPNWATDPDFARQLLEAQRQGVAVLAWDCRVTPDSLTAGEPVELRLEGSTPWDR